MSDHISGGSMPWDAYLRHPGNNWSRLKHIGKSPKHYRFERGNPDTDTTARMKGRATHALVFEPETFAERFAIWSGGRRQGHDWTMFQRDHAGLTILTADEYEGVAAQARAVREHPAMRPYLEGGAFERVTVWTDRATGLLCKSRLDLMHYPHGFEGDVEAIVDLKGVPSLDPRRLRWHIVDQLYHGQLAFYGRGVETVTEVRPRKLVIVAHEYRPPYDVAVLVLDESVRCVGEDLVDDYLGTLARCLETDTWPGRYPDEERFTISDEITGSLEGESSDDYP